MTWTAPEVTRIDVARLRTEWELARQAVAGAPLDQEFLSERRGQMSLRWLYQHMIEAATR